MNCKQVEEQLPLYVGRDLDEERARLVNAHVQVCSECALSAREYGETHQLLQMFEAPKFSDDTYDAVRGRVLREIQRTPRLPGLMEFFLRPLPQPVTWAVSAAVMVVVCLFAYYFLADRMSQQTYRPQLAAHSDAGKKDPVAERVNTGTADASSAPAPNSHKPRFNQRVWHSTREGGAPAVPVRSALNSPVEPNNASLNTSATADKTIRLEIQTSDPNIRIIWFSQPTNKQGSPNESSKGI